MTTNNNMTEENAAATKIQNTAMQTASLNNQSMMTYMPEQQQPQGGPSPEAFDNDYNIMDADETQFKASLDALLDIDDVVEQERPKQTMEPMPPASLLTQQQRLAAAPFPPPHNIMPQQSATTNPAPPPPYMVTSSSTTKQHHHHHDPPDVSENESERKRRKRNDRNVREQQRSHRITQQISVLRGVLESAGVNFKPDKYSTLVGVAEFIKQLRQRCALLDTQHEALKKTLEKTGQIVAESKNHVVVKKEEQTIVQPEKVESSNNNVVHDDDTNHDDFQQGLDYNRIFQVCGVALAVASIDGRFMDANQEFERLSGYTFEELLPSDEKKNLSLFNLFSRQDMEQLFGAMSEMLKRPFDNKLEKDKDYQDFWSGRVGQNRRVASEEKMMLQMNITLVRSPHGRPKFFCCALTPEATP